MCIIVQAEEQEHEEEDVLFENHTGRTDAVNENGKGDARKDHGDLHSGSDQRLCIEHRYGGELTAVPLRAK